MSIQAVRPITLWGDTGHQVNQQHQGVVDMAFLFLTFVSFAFWLVMEVFPQVGWLLARKLELHGEFSIPQSAMVGRSVSHDAEMVKQRTERCFI